METKILSGALGVEITGVDLSSPLTEVEQQEIKSLALEHVVVLFRGQDLDAAAQLALTRIFGEPEPHPLKTRRTLADHPEVLILENRPGKPGAANDYWHSDISHAACPPSVTILHAKIVPQGRGDTLICNMYRSYDVLSPGLQEALSELRAFHSGEATLRRNAGDNDGLAITQVPEPVLHPIVRSHPETGRKAIYVNPYFVTGIEDMTPEESAPILAPVYAMATRHENIYRHRWEVGDVLLWDNRCAMHYAVLDYDDTMARLMHRTTAAGDRPS